MLRPQRKRITVAEAFAGKQSTAASGGALTAKVDVNHCTEQFSRHQPTELGERDVTLGPMCVRTDDCNACAGESSCHEATTSDTHEVSEPSCTHEDDASVSAGEGTLHGPKSVVRHIVTAELPAGEEEPSQLFFRKSTRKRTTIAAAFAATLEARTKPDVLHTEVDSDACGCVSDASKADKVEHVSPDDCRRRQQCTPEQEPGPTVMSRSGYSAGPSSGSLDVELARGAASGFAHASSSGHSHVMGDLSPQFSQREDLEFEIWVETDLQASWCLEDTGSGDAPQWRGSCQTASLRRRWEEFEALGQSGALGTQDLTVKEALELLGLPQTATGAQLSSAFRSQSRHCHPDKVGPSAAFDMLVAAYQVAQRALSDAQ